MHSIKRHWRLLALAFAAYAAVLVATAPATLVDVGLQNASKGRLRLAEAQGTLWSGTGQIEFLDAGGHSGFARHVAWHFQPGALIHAQLDYRMMLDQESRPFSLTISWSRIQIADVDIRLPATTLGLVSSKLAALSLTGEVQLQIASLSVGRDAMLGGAMLLWRTAGSALSPVSPLGDYELRFEGKGPVIRTALHTLHGPLQLDGQGSWADGRNLGFLVTARIPPEFQEQLWPFLRLIAVERGDGSFELQIK